MRGKNWQLPGNPRYQPKELGPYFGYDNTVRWYSLVELSTLEALAEIGMIPEEEFAQLTPEMCEAVLGITTTQVDETERKVTKHDIRALVLEIQKVLPAPLSRWIHVPLTSYDVIDTARSVQYQSAYFDVLKPAIAEVTQELDKLIVQTQDIPMIGRTHGQHAIPITVGFWLATLLQRITECWKEMEISCEGLRGKISGPVGAKNAQCVYGLDKLSGDVSFEERVLSKLGLEPALGSTQILPPEPLAKFLFSCTLMSAALGQLGRDCRHLMRTEIAELTEEYSSGQTGSSTMAHKRNPISFEGLEGMGLKSKNEFGKVLDTLISEHQRDLVGSGPARDFPTILVNVMSQLNTLRRKDKTGRSFLSRIRIDEERCAKNLGEQSSVFCAELLYIALVISEYNGDAHHFVNHELVPEVKKTGTTFREVLSEKIETDTWLRGAVATMPPELISLISDHPETYMGDAMGIMTKIITQTREWRNQRMEKPWVRRVPAPRDED